MIRFLLYCFILFFPFQVLFSQSTTVLFSDNFDTEEFDEQWTIIKNHPSRNWTIARQPSSPFYLIDENSVYSALCPWAYDTIQQDEWLISKELNTEEYQSLHLYFYAGYNELLLDSALLNIYLKQSDDTTKIWNVSEIGDTITEWKWRYVDVDLIDHVGETFQLVWQYYGNYGDLIGLDNIQLIGGPPNTEANIISYELSEETDEATIDTSENQVLIYVNYGADLENLEPDIKISSGASYQQISCTTQSDTMAVITYLITASNTAYKKEWTVTVKTGQSTDTDIVSFTVNNQAAKTVFDYDEYTITAIIEKDADLDSIVPTIEVVEGATISPASGEIQSFTEDEAITYTVTAADTLVKNTWDVYVRRIGTGNNIESFTLPIAQIGNAVFDTINHTITVDVGSDEDIDALAPVITISDYAEIEPESDSTVSFTDGEPFEYTVTAENGVQQIWTVTISQLPILLYEDFDTDSLFTYGWSVVSGSDHTWQIDTLYDLPYPSNEEKTTSILCPWYYEDQEEWLISPLKSAEEFKSLTLSFCTAFAKKWIKQEGDTSGFNTTVYITTSGADSVDWLADGLPIWSANDYAEANDTLSWYTIEVNLNQYIEQNIRLAWMYEGVYGDLVGIDDVIIAGSKTGTVGLTTTDKQSDFKLYPNPARDYTNITNALNATICVFSLDGQLIQSDKSTSGIFTLDTQNYINGTYIIRILKNGCYGYKKMVIVH